MRPDPAKAAPWDRVLDHLKRAVAIAPLLSTAPEADFAHIKTLVAKHVDAAHALLVEPS